MSQRASDRPVGPSRSAIDLLADPVSRAVIVTLGELDAEQDGLVVTEAALDGASPRLIQSRVRELDRHGIVRAIAAGPNQPRRWRLTEAGRDLFRLQTLMTRVILRASQRPATTPAPIRDTAFGGVLSGLADPVTAQLCLALARATAPIGPVPLEEQCAPTPRRTLYRRLGALVDAGVVERRSGHTVPRTTFYVLVDTWRPAAAIPVLAAWWESRHWGDHTDPVGDVPVGLLAAVLPLARIGAGHDGRTLSWHADGGSGVRLVVERDRLRIDDAGGAGADVAVRGSIDAWCTAMVTDRRDRLHTEGERTLAQAAITAVRTALLAYVR